jgi:queuine tRNA-ribosyltransferase
MTDSAKDTMTKNESTTRTTTMAGGASAAAAAVTNSSSIPPSSSPTNSRPPHKKKKSPPPPPPPLADPSDFPDWAYQPRDFFKFEVLHQSTKSQARVGRIHTPHGIIDTPSFVAVATNAALKGVDFRSADQANQQLIFANTYHLLLHPGADLIQEAGGIHKFTNRPQGPFITDSGGFQVFSLAYGSVHEELSSGGELKKRSARKSQGNSSGGSSSSSSSRSSGNHHNGDAAPVKVTEDGATFRSYRDGSQFLLTPESTVQAQKMIGADIIIPLDELPPYHIDRQVLSESVDRSHRWEARSLQEHLKNVQEQAMYCVVHGGIDVEFRTKSINYLTSLPFDGYAIGGSLGNGRQELKELLSWMMPLFDATEERKSKPRHLLGIADEESIRHAVTKGIDTLDSCYPTRLARHGTILVRGDNSGSSEGSSIKIGSGKYARQFGVPLDENCQCSTCQHYDRAYLRHLFKANEPIAVTLAAQHNIQYMNDLMARIRQDIMNNVI